MHRVIHADHAAALSRLLDSPEQLPALKKEHA
jgi:hypothetical protein